MNLIVAADKNWAIGNRGRLLVDDPGGPEAVPPGDSGKGHRHGKEDHGEPAGRPGPSGRTNVVLTRNRDYKKRDENSGPRDGRGPFLFKQFPDDDIYIIGGGEIYRQFLPYCRTAHVTRIDYAYEADTHFPDLDQDPDWQVTAESDEQTYFSLCYEFCRYDRKMEEKTYEKKE